MERSFPAGSGECMQYLAHEFNDTTLRFVLQYPGVVDAEILADAAVALTASVDILHASFVAHRVHAEWIEHPNFARADCFAVVRTDNDPMETAKEIAVQPIRAEDPAKIFCTLVQGPDSAALVLRISHLCADGVDGKYLLDKLVEAYNLRLQTGSCHGLQVKNGNRAPEQMYDYLSDEEKKALMKNPLSGVKNGFPFPDIRQGRPDACVQIIPADIMSAARARARGENATANDLLMAACYHAYAALPEVDAKAPMSVLGMMDMRRHCKDISALGLCNMAGSLPTVLQEGVSDTFSETLARIAAQTNAAKEDPCAGLKGLPLLHMATRRLPMWLLQKAARRVYGGMGFGMTNIGNLNLEQYCLGPLRPVGGWFGGPLKKKPSMQVSVASFDGACALSIVGEFTQQDAAALAAFLQAMAKEIENYA